MNDFFFDPDEPEADAFELDAPSAPEPVKAPVDRSHYYTSKRAMDDANHFPWRKMLGSLLVVFALIGGGVYAFFTFQHILFPAPVETVEAPLAPLVEELIEGKQVNGLLPESPNPVPYGVCAELPWGAGVVVADGFKKKDRKLLADLIDDFNDRGWALEVSDALPQPDGRGTFIVFKRLGSGNTVRVNSHISVTTVGKNEYSVSPVESRQFISVSDVSVPGSLLDGSQAKAALLDAMIDALGVNLENSTVGKFNANTEVALDYQLGMSCNAQTMFPRPAKMSVK